jgi:hypothetical protein
MYFSPFAHGRPGGLVAKSVMFWVNLGLLLTGLALFAFGLAMLGSGAWVPGGILAGLGALCLAIVSITGPVARWGAAGLLLTFGVVVAAGGAVAWAVGDIGSETVAALDEDNDGDGRVNEDPFGDSDRSNSGPTEIDNLAEAQNHADDDGDGLVDEDPPEPGGAREVTERVAGIGKLATFIGLGLLGLFGFLAVRLEQDRAKERRRSRASGFPLSPPQS